MLHANNKGTDQPAQSDQHLCFHCLDSIMPLVSITEISSLYLAAVAVQAGLCLAWLFMLCTEPV